MTTDPKNFVYGILMQEMYKNFLQAAGYRVKGTGQEYVFPFSMDFISRASANELDPETAKIALELKKLPDFLAIKETHTDLSILRGEVRCKKNMPKRIENFICQYDEEEEFEFIRENYRRTRLIYLDVPNKNVRALNTEFAWDDPRQLDFWNNPLTYVKLNQDQYDILIEKYLWQCAIDVADRIIDYLRPVEFLSRSPDTETEIIEPIF
tara:strand:- start:276 stop:902 length:627 start_codon:yes stop_codon:yes gene_type:complete